MPDSSLPVSCAAIIAMLAIAEPARAAAPRESSEVAQSLFDKARELMETGDYARACPMFAESQRLDPGGGTLLNLAICHEKEGKIATAWSELTAALSLAQRDNRADWIDVAKAHLAEIAPHVPRLLIVVPEPSNFVGLTVKLDGVEVSRAAWGAPMPVDPGQHTVEASARGKKTYVTAAVVRPDGVTLEIEIPPLEAGPSLGSPPEPRSLSATTDASPGRPALFWVGVTTAATGAAVGGITGVMALKAHDDVATKCPGGICTDVSGIDDASRARTMAWVSTIALGVALAGVVFVVLAPSKTSRTAMTWRGPVLSF